LRGGAYKPRTSPYAFQGLKEDGLKLLAEARDATGLLVVTEVKDTETLPMVSAHADLLQVGARNMQNYSLLEAVGKQERPVLLKRGMSATIKELLMAAEYIVNAGNPNVLLCERGIRTFETMTRNTFDVGAIHMLRTLTHLPVIADPSHGIGIWHGVGPLARAAVVVGAHGLIIEVHPNPADALSDGPQSLKPARFDRLMQEIKGLRQLLKGEYA
jgi:3-deoxy-7-phosphoheptulonate synthase